MIKESFYKDSLSFLEASEIQDFKYAMEQAPSISIRYNTHKQTGPKTDGNPVPWCKNAIYLAQKPVFTLDPSLHAGGYYVQEASSMFLETIWPQLQLPSNAMVLDLCAAPGGKSTHLLCLMTAEQLLVSNEVIKTRIAPLRENLIKWGCENIIITQNDASDYASLEECFDLVVVDAPCSGEGMFRKDPDSALEWSSENVDICSKRQRRILSEIETAVKPGGYLIYSTCTYNKKEDEETISWFMSEFSYQEIKIPTEGIQGVKSCELGYKFMPHLIAGEGFYVCILQKQGSLESSEYTQSKRSAWEFYKAPQEVLKMIKNAEPHGFYIFKDTVKYFLPTHKHRLDMLSKHLNIITAGLDVGSLLKNKLLIPEHSLAMSRLLEADLWDPVELSLEDSLKYLKKELPDIDCSQGMHLACYQGLPMGFFKKVNQRINNAYPQEWRIRMAIN